MFTLKIVLADAPAAVHPERRLPGRPMNAAARAASLLSHGARCSSQGESPSDHVDSCEMRSPNLKERNETG